MAKKTYCYLCDRASAEPIVDEADPMIRRLGKDPLCKQHKDFLDYYIRFPDKLLQKNDRLLETLRSK